MNDDIVTRLEQEHWCDADNCNLAQLAADEIERLRAGFRLMAKAYLQDLGMDRHGWNPDELCAEFVSKAVCDE